MSALWIETRECAFAVRILIHQLQRRRLHFDIFVSNYHWRTRDKSNLKLKIDINNYTVYYYFF